MARCRLLALDLDGTLLRDDGEIDPRDVEGVERAGRQGIEVVLATGRLAGTALGCARRLRLAGPIICADGGLLVDVREGRTLERHALPASGRRLLLELAAAAELVPLFLSADTVIGPLAGAALTSFLAGWSSHFQPTPLVALAAVPVELLVGFALGPADRVARALASVPSSAASEVVADSFPFGDPGPWALRLRPVGVNKGRALAELAARLGVSRAETAAVGDWYNDLEMLRWAGRSFVMGQAPSQVAEAAQQRLTATARSGGGVAEAIARLLEDMNDPPVSQPAAAFSAGKPSC